MAAHSRRPRPLTAPKRLSAIRLSTDTTSSLPAYSSPPSTRPAPQSGWPIKDHLHLLDEPPDYPQSAEEADQEDDFVPQRVLRATASRKLRHRRGESLSVPNSPSVDDLLERSVVALEMSTNALLQSMDTQSKVSAIANDHVVEHSLARQTRMLDLRLRGTRVNHDHWMDDLDDVMERVNDLFGEHSDADAGISRSLPTGNSLIPRRRHHHHQQHHLPKSKSESAYLHLSTSELDVRDTVRPPRALTQYVCVESTSGDASEATADPNSIYLPSTTGLRSAAQIQSFSETDARPHCLRKSISSPGPSFGSTPPPSAYNMLAHLASNQSSPTRTTTSQSSPSVSDSTSRTVRRHSGGSFDSTFTFPHSLRRSRSTSRSRSSASIDVQTAPLPPVRAMTPPMEESPSSSSESGHGVNAFRTMQSLRKILDEAPDPKGKSPMVERPPRPVFRPRTPAVAPSFGTSTATASVSRLFTRSSHHGSSHHSQPRQSSLKQSNSKPGTPIPPAASGCLTPGSLTPGSQASSNPSTPRQVSFAELPETHSGQSSWRKGKGKEKAKAKKDKAYEDSGWWSGWLTSSGASAAVRYEERIEDRMMRGWGRPTGGGGVTDEWML